METLGLWQSPDGLSTDQAEKMAKMVEKWTGNLVGSYLERHNAWRAFKTQIW